MRSVVRAVVLLIGINVSGNDVMCLWVFVELCLTKKVQD